MPITPTHVLCGYWWKGLVSMVVSIELIASKLEILLYPLYPDGSLGGYGAFETVIPLCESSAIGYTSLGMNINEEMDLTVENPEDGMSYSWSIISGGGSLSSSTGLEVTYTAPGYNAYCLQNPTITLSVGSTVCDTITLNVNGFSQSNHAWAWWYDKDCIDQVTQYSCHLKAKRGYCDGTVVAGFDPCTITTADQTPPYSCDSCWNNTIWADCQAVGYTINIQEAKHPEDLRTTIMKASGCCPWRLSSYP